MGILESVKVLFIGALKIDKVFTILKESKCDRRTGNTVFGAQNGDVNSYDEVDKAFPTDSGRAWEQGYSFVTCMGSKNSKYVCKHNYIPLPIRQPAR